MPTARVAAGGAVVGGKLYVMGGRNRACYLDVVEVYNLVTNSWATRAAMTTARAGLGVGAVNHLIYAVGGSYNTNILVVNERYTP